MLVRALVGGSVATGLYSGATAALGDFTIVGTAFFGVAMTFFFALWPPFRRSANRGAKPSNP